MKKKLLYADHLCSPTLMEYIFNSSDKKVGQAGPKFHRLLAEGFAFHHEVCIIETLSAIPLTPSSHKRRIWKIPSEKIGNLKYNYITVINIPVLKNIFICIFAFFNAIYWALRGGRKNKFVICDVLNASVSIAVLLACKLTGTKAIAIVTDVPHLIIGCKRECGFIREIHNKLVMASISSYDGYILLTEQMNLVINKNAKPCIIMEGLVDDNMKTAGNLLVNKAPEKIVIYSGAIFEKYGIKKLIEAFKILEGDDLRLHIYGSGEMEKDMGGYMKQDPRIVYFGVVHNSEVVQKQLQATLLVNPRPTSEEYTKYSFPSKNMEYMVSGTPMVTTALSGMPAEYYPFVYLFDNETVEGFYRTLKAILTKPKEELHLFGQSAKQFVLTYKNNNYQANRMLDFFDGI